MKQKISLEYGLSIAIVCATVVGGMLWYMNRESIVDDATVMTDTAPSSQTPADTAVIPVPVQTVAIEKWAALGIADWSDHEVFSTGITAMTPKKNAIVQYIEEKKSVDSTRTVFGYMTINSKNTKLWGTVSVSTFREMIGNGGDLEQFIRAQGKIIHEDYCKQYGVDDIRYSDGVCHTDISHVRRISDTVIAWNEDFISSPEIVSARMSDGRVINFQSSQDNSSDEDLIALIEDIAKTARPNTPAQQK